jgi:hypothetical protein
MYPVEYPFIDAILNANSRDILNGPIPLLVNDVGSCSSAVFLDAFTESFHIKVALRFLSANKTLGDANTLVIASRVPQYIASIGIMLDALSLRDSELELFHIPPNRDVVDRIIESFEGLQRTLTEVRTKFEKVKSS